MVCPRPVGCGDETLGSGSGLWARRVSGFWSTVRAFDSNRSPGPVRCPREVRCEAVGFVKRAGGH